VWLIGTGDQTAVVGHAGSAVTTISTTSEAPPLHLDGLALHVRFRVRGGQATFTNCTFVAAFEVSAGEVSFRAAEFRGIAGSMGRRAVTISGGEIFMQAALFERNFADTSGGALQITGGCTSLSNCTFLSNRAESDGGAICITNGSLVVASARFVNNSASADGGAISISTAAVTVTSAALVANAALGSGGGIKMQSGSLILRSCQIAENSAARDGGGIQILAGTLTMADETSLRGNMAAPTVARGTSALDIRAAGVTYALMAPPGRWIASAFVCKRYPFVNVQPCDLSRSELVNKTISVLPIGGVDNDYPFSCAPGLYADEASGFAGQSSPTCSGA